MNPDVIEKPSFTLLPKDRCDRCGAQAYMKATKGKVDLLFCAHHGTKHESALRGQGFSVLDETDALLYN